MYSRFNNNKPMKVNATQTGDPKWKLCVFYILNLIQKQLGCTIRHVKKQWKCRNKFDPWNWIKCQCKFPLLKYTFILIIWICDNTIRNSFLIIWVHLGGKIWRNDSSNYSKMYKKIDFQAMNVVISSKKKFLTWSTCK